MACRVHSFLVHTAHHIGISLWKQLLSSLSKLLGPAVLWAPPALTGLRSPCWEWGHLLPSLSTPTYGLLKGLSRPESLLPRSPEWCSSCDWQQHASRIMLSCSSPNQEPPQGLSGSTELKEQLTLKRLCQAQDLLSRATSDCQLNVLQGDTNKICILWTSHR